ncbi:hypothetical protein B0T22DRAFT_461468 [Podospora appendiculata]|uniref:Uncharacterized protein n=1 Tax=Podospora appendiculata TaxID=314037 RepID=A0AAE0XB82_9PEZI|nr:hypothetical protein B0T22DRAFT_461468 [Podospora appendiculata]
MVYDNYDHTSTQATIEFGMDPELVSQQPLDNGGELTSHLSPCHAASFAAFNEAMQLPMRMGKPTHLGLPPSTYEQFPILSFGLPITGQFTSSLPADNSDSVQGHFPQHQDPSVIHPQQTQDSSYLQPQATSVHPNHMHHQTYSYSALPGYTGPPFPHQQPQKLKLSGKDYRNTYVQGSANLAAQSPIQQLNPSPSPAPSSIVAEETTRPPTDSWTRELDSLILQGKREKKSNNEISAEAQKKFGVRKNSNVISKRYAKLRNKSVSKDLLDQVTTKLAPLISNILDEELSKVGVRLSRDVSGGRHEQAITAAAYQEASRVVKMRSFLHKHVQSCVLDATETAEGTEDPEF